MAVLLTVLEITRVVLFIAEWLMSVIVWGATGTESSHEHLWHPFDLPLREAVSSSSVRLTIFMRCFWLYAFRISFHLFLLVADKLDYAGFCYFGKKSSCGSIIFFGLSASIILTAVIVNYIVSLTAAKYAFGRGLETAAYILMTSIWALIAIIAAVGSPKSHTRAIGSVVLFLSWVNVLTHGLSAGLAYFLCKMDPVHEARPEPI